MRRTTSCSIYTKPLQNYFFRGFTSRLYAPNFGYKLPKFYLFSTTSKRLYHLSKFHKSPFTHPFRKSSKKKGPDARPETLITKEEDKAFRMRANSWFDYRVALISVSIGSFIALLTYTYLQLSNLFIAWRTKWLELGEGPSIPKNLQDFLSFPYPVYSIFIWTTAATLTTLFAWSRGRWRWYRRQFMGRVNFSLNSITKDNHLIFRTVFERSLFEMMFRNQAAVNMIASAANKTYIGSPFLNIEEEENWYILNNILNEISTAYSVGFFQRSVGLPTINRFYIFGMTCEKDPGVWNKKLRVMLIEENELEKLYDQEITIDLEEPYHSVRRNTLTEMATLWHEQKNGGPCRLGRLELCISAGTASTMANLGRYVESDVVKEEKEKSY